MGSAPFVAVTKVPTVRAGAEERQRRLEEAKAFLVWELAGGAQAAKTLLQAAKTAKIAERTLHRAKDQLGVKTAHTGWHGHWVWQPPVGEAQTLEAATSVA